MNRQTDRQQTDEERARALLALALGAHGLSGTLRLLADTLERAAPLARALAGCGDADEAASARLQAGLRKLADSPDAEQLDEVLLA